jgi:hypothetical protein
MNAVLWGMVPCRSHERLLTLFLASGFVFSSLGCSGTASTIDETTCWRVRFEVFVAGTMKNGVFRDVISSQRASFASCS